MFTDIEAAIEECRYRAETEATGKKPKRYLSIVQKKHGFMEVVETIWARRMNLPIMYSVGCDRYHTVLPEVR